MSTPAATTAEAPATNTPGLSPAQPPANQTYGRDAIVVGAHGHIEAAALSDAVRTLRAHVLASWHNGTPVALDGFYYPENSQARLIATQPEQKATFQLVFQPSPVVDAATQVSGGPLPRAFVETYEGHVAGNNDQLARLTFASTWARGSVRMGDHTYELRFGALPGVDDAATNAQPQRAAIPAVATHAHPLEGAAPTGSPDVLTCTSDPVVGGERDPRTFKLVTARGRSQDPLRLAQLIFDTDNATRGLLGNDTLPFLAFSAQELDLVYANEIGVRFHLAEAVLDSPDLPTGSNFELAARWNARNDPRDLVVMATGRSPSVVGGEGGQAYCIGAAGFPEYAYATIGIGTQALQLAHFYDYLLTHEVGHLFNLMHVDGDNTESDAGTIMFQAVVASGFNLVMGTMERSYGRGWAETHIPPAPDGWTEP